MSNVVGITGSLTFDFEQMLSDAMVLRPDSIKKVVNECEVVDAEALFSAKHGCDYIDDNTWFMCVNSATNEGYYFPVCESENRDNDYKRVKSGIAYFMGKGWQAYKIQ